MLVWALALLFFIGSLFSLEGAHIMKNASTEISSGKSALLQSETGRVELWYQSNVSSIDNQTGQVPPTLSTGQWGLTALSSKLIACPSGVYAHKYALVLPGAQGLRTTMDPTTGNVAIANGDMVQIIDGCVTEQQLMTNSENGGLSIVAALENYSRGEEIQDGNSSTKNYFTSSACGGWGNIPCTSDSTVDALQPVIGLVNGDRYSAYGGMYHYDNYSTVVNASGPPYEARVGFDTPWGVRQWLIAIASN